MLLGFTITDCPDPRAGRRLPARGAPDVVLRACRASGRSSRPRSRPASRPSRTRQQEGRRSRGARRRRSRRCGSSRRASRCPTSSRSVRAGRRAGALQDPRELGLDQRRVGQRRRGADAARGDRVLPRDRHPARGALGHVRDLRRRHLQPARARSRSAPSARRCPGVEIKLAEDGEVLIRGPVVMRGYRNQPEKTAETIDRRRLAAHRRHRRVRRRRLPEDRRPQEGADHQRGRQEHVAGEHRGEAQGGEPADRPGDRDRRRPPYNVALITLDPDAAPAFAQQHGIEDASLESLADDEAVVDEVQRGVDAANEKLARVEQIKKFKSCRRVAARRRRADPDDEAQAQADPREVRRRRSKRRTRNVADAVRP